MKVLPAVVLLTIALTTIQNIVTLSDTSMTSALQSISDTIGQPCNYAYWKIVTEPYLNSFGSRRTEMKLIGLLISQSQNNSNLTFALSKLNAKDDEILHTHLEAWKELLNQSIMAGRKPLPSVYYTR